DGVGLAAPQVGLPIRLFVIDTLQIEDEEGNKKEDGFKRVFINAERLEESGKLWAYEEGCLSIPKIRGEVDRMERIRLRWVDENFEPHEETFEGINARVIQHEYDHTEGILFTEKLKPLKKRMIQRRLESIRMGNISTEYKMRFYAVR
ncbi:MAG TPA: peptide deformylase, partial [Saprospiraceae bacterium]|nr:peptide deformylase [Saprospiraceae bacterium]